MDAPEKRSVAPQPALPDDPLVEILSRVSVKDLYRSKCVSKAWCKLIADPIRRKKLPQTLEGFFYGGGDAGYGRYIDLMNRPVPLVDPSFSFLHNFLPGIYCVNLLHSCNGLLLFEHRRNPDTPEFVVCNPATERLVAVPPSPLKKNKDGNWFDSDTFLMFDPAVSSHFHLIQCWRSFELGVAAVHTFSSVTGIWSDRESEWRAGEEGGEWAQWGESSFMSLCSTLFNNMLHFVVRDFGIGLEFQGMIVAVDVEGKTCRVIPWQEGSAYPAFVCQSQGRLFCISEGLQKSELSIWVLEDYDTKEWSLQHRVSFMKLFGKMHCDYCEYTAVAMHPDRNLIFFSEHGIFSDHGNLKAISYDMDSEEVHALCTHGHNYRSIIPYVPYFSDLQGLTNQN